MTVRLNGASWKQVWKNVAEIQEQDEAQGFDPMEHEVQAVWLEGDPSKGLPEEWVIASGEEMLEDGFSSEEEAEQRLREVEQFME